MDNLEPKSRHHLFRLGTINVHTCKCESKLADCVTQFKNLEQDMCMQLSRMRGEGEIRFDDPVLNGWHVVYNGMSIARAGVAIVMAPHIRLVDIEHIMEGKMTMVRVKANGVKLVMYSCYCPTEEHSTSSKETFYRTLHRAIQKTRKEHPSYKIIAAGDFNATIGQDCNHETWIGVGPYHDEDPTSFNGKKTP